MTIPQKAVQFVLAVANDNSHGYDQNSRWGSPDYDCSSLIITAYKKAGLPLQSTYTGNMRNDFFQNGFAVPSNVNLATGAGLEPGDVLLHETHHTAMYVGNGQIVHATGNEYGKATGGQPGDQTGKEICVAPYFNYPWEYVLRYVRKDADVPDTDDGNTYTVQKGDSLWSIAEKLLGSGFKYVQIMNANNMTSSMIYPGMVLAIPADGKKTITVTVTEETYKKLNELANGKPLGDVIDGMVSNA